MVRSHSYSLSEGIVCLSRPSNGPGIKVHATADQSAFVTIYCSMCIDLNDTDNVDNNRNAEAPNEYAIVRITIGNCPHALAIPVPVHGKTTTLISNVWVDAFQEIWISSTRPKQHVVTGFASSHPIA